MGRYFGNVQRVVRPLGSVPIRSLSNITVHLIGGRSPKVIAPRQNDYCLPFHGRRFSANCTTKERLLQYNLTGFVPFLQELIKIKKKMQKNPKISKLVLLGYLYLYLWMKNIRLHVMIHMMFYLI